MVHKNNALTFNAPKQRSYRLCLTAQQQAQQYQQQHHVGATRGMKAPSSPTLSSLNCSLPPFSIPHQHATQSVSTATKHKVFQSQGKQLDSFNKSECLIHFSGPHTPQTPRTPLQSGGLWFGSHPSPAVSSSPSPLSTNKRQPATITPKYRRSNSVGSSSCNSSCIRRNGNALTLTPSTTPQSPALSDSGTPTQSPIGSACRPCHSRSKQNSGTTNVSQRSSQPHFYFSRIPGSTKSVSATITTNGKHRKKHKGPRRSHSLAQPSKDIARAGPLAAACSRLHNNTSLPGAPQPDLRNHSGSVGKARRALAINLPSRRDGNSVCIAQTAQMLTTTTSCSAGNHSSQSPHISHQQMISPWSTHSQSSSCSLNTSTSSSSSGYAPVERTLVYASEDDAESNGSPERNISPRSRNLRSSFLHPVNQSPTKQDFCFVPCSPPFDTGNTKSSSTRSSSVGNLTSDISPKPFVVVNEVVAVGGSNATAEDALLELDNSPGLSLSPVYGSFVSEGKPLKNRRRLNKNASVTPRSNAVRKIPTNCASVKSPNSKQQPECSSSPERSSSRKVPRQTRVSRRQSTCKQWVCPSCTLLNEQNASSCSACLQLKPHIFSAVSTSSTSLLDEPLSQAFDDPDLHPRNAITSSHTNALTSDGPDLCLGVPQGSFVATSHLPANTDAELPHSNVAVEGKTFTRLSEMPPQQRGLLTRNRKRMDRSSGPGNRSRSPKKMAKRARSSSDNSSSS